MRSRQLRSNRGARRRQKRSEPIGDAPQALGYRQELGPRRRQAPVFYIIPRLRRRDLLIECCDLAPDLGECKVEAKGAEMFVVVAGRWERRRGESVDPRRLAQRGDAGDEVADAVDEIGLVRRLEALGTEVGILERPHVAEQKVSHAVDADAANVVGGIDGVAGRLTDLPAVVDRKSVV